MLLDYCICAFKQQKWPKEVCQWEWNTLGPGGGAGCEIAHLHFKQLDRNELLSDTPRNMEITTNSDLSIVVPLYKDHNYDLNVKSEI